jgi:putative DNA methylase
VASPNPAAKGTRVPLIRSFWLSTKDKSNQTFIKPIIDKKQNKVEFIVKNGAPGESFDPGKGTVNRNGATCLLTDAPIPFEYIRSEGKRGCLSNKLLAIVAELPRGRTYVSPTDEQEKWANIILNDDAPDTDVPEKALGFRVQLYGMNKHFKMFSPRQLTAMVTLSDLVKEAHKDVLKDAQEVGMSPSDAGEYAKTVTTFLALALDRCSDFNNALCRWTSGNQKVMNLFGKQAIPMVWDFAEANILGDSVGAWKTCTDYVADCIEVIGKSGGKYGKARQADAANSWNNVRGLLVSTDPPYYDNIGYAALSDFF